jgi:uncharacterized protein YjbJ (UPF0337 family)
MLNQDQIIGRWTEISVEIRNLWGEITDDELDHIKGDISSLHGIIQQKYGLTTEESDAELERLLVSIEKGPTAVRTTEKSQNQDSTSDIKTRSPERATFDKKQALIAKEKNRLV